MTNQNLNILASYCGQQGMLSLGMCRIGVGTGSWEQTEPGVGKSTGRL